MAKQTFFGISVKAAAITGAVIGFFAGCWSSLSVSSVMK